MKIKRMCLDDYKITSVYAVKDGCKPEWAAQLNIYALMLREHGYKVDRLRIIAILRDWQKSKARHSRDYPQVPALVIPVPVWPTAKIEDYITARLIAHGRAQHEIPECSPEERWERPGCWALYRIGNSRATSLHDTPAGAETARAAAEIGNKKAGFEIRERPPEQIRCSEYCSCLPFCEQGKALVRSAEEFHIRHSAWVIARPHASAV